MKPAAEWAAEDPCLSYESEANQEDCEAFVNDIRREVLTEVARLAGHPTTTKTEFLKALSDLNSIFIPYTNEQGTISKE